MAGLDYAHRAVDLKPDDPELLSTLARAYYVEEQFQDAVQTQLRALDLAPASNKAEYRAALDEYQRAWDRRKAGAKKTGNWPAK
jgi:Flp pilus assembly protein TadD